MMAWSDPEKKTILVPGEEKARAFHEEEKRLQKFPGVTNLNRNGGAI
jgi:hypothetical protein